MSNTHSTWSRPCTRLAILRRRRREFQVRSGFPRGRASVVRVGPVRIASSCPEHQVRRLPHRRLDPGDLVARVGGGGDVRRRVHDARAVVRRRQAPGTAAGTNPRRGAVDPGRTRRRSTGSRRGSRRRLVDHLRRLAASRRRTPSWTRRRTRVVGSVRTRRRGRRRRRGPVGDDVGFHDAAVLRRRAQLGRARRRRAWHSASASRRQYHRSSDGIVRGAIERTRRRRAISSSWCTAPASASRRASTYALAVGLGPRESGASSSPAAAYTADQVVPGTSIGTSPTLPPRGTSRSSTVASVPALRRELVGDFLDRPAAPAKRLRATLLVHPSSALRAFAVRRTVASSRCEGTWPAAHASQNAAFAGNGDSSHSMSSAPLKKKSSASFAAWFFAVVATVRDIAAALVRRRRRQHQRVDVVGVPARASAPPAPSGQGQPGVELREEPSPNPKSAPRRIHSRARRATTCCSAWRFAVEPVRVQNLVHSRRVPAAVRRPELREVLAGRAEASPRPRDDHVVADEDAVVTHVHLARGVRKAEDRLVPDERLLGTVRDANPEGPRREGRDDGVEQRQTRAVRRLDDPLGSTAPGYIAYLRVRRVVAVRRRQRRRVDVGCVKRGVVRPSPWRRPSDRSADRASVGASTYSLLRAPR